MSRLHTTWQHIRRSPYQSLLAIMITTLTFFVVGLVVYSAFVSSALLHYFEQKPQITVFFSDKKKDNAVDDLKTRLHQTGKVASMRYVSKEEALKIYQERFKSDPLLLEMVTADILPSSLEISTTEPIFLSDIAKILRQEADVDEIIYQKDIIDTLLTWTATIRKAGSAMIVFFSLLTVLVTLTITGMKIILRRSEIDILKLVGATRWYISLPFITEGIIYGIIGAILGWTLSHALLLYGTPFLFSLFQGIPALTLSISLSPIVLHSITLIIWPMSLQFMGFVLILLLVIGATLGFIGSSIALLRYI